MVRTKIKPALQTNDVPEGVRRDEPVTCIAAAAAVGSSAGTSSSNDSQGGTNGVVNAGIYYGSGLIRPAPGTQPYKDLAGYNAARADFDSEFDNQASTTHRARI